MEKKEKKDRHGPKKSHFLHPSTEAILLWEILPVKQIRKGIKYSDHTP